MKLSEDSSNFRKYSDLNEINQVFFAATEHESDGRKVLEENKNINRLVLKTIMEVLKNVGIDFRNNKNSLDEFCGNCRESILNKFIVKNWINTLISFGVLKDLGSKYDICDFDFEVENNVEFSRKIFEYVTNLTPELINILKNNKEAIQVFYTDDNRFSINHLSENLTGYDESIEIILLSLKKFIDLNSSRKLKILEYGTRSEKITKEIFENIKNSVEEYIYVDNSVYYKNKLLDLNKYENFDYIVFGKELGEKFENDYFDIIIALNSIHRSNDSGKLINDMVDMLKVNGLIIGNEINRCNLLHAITADIIENRDISDNCEINLINKNSEIIYESNKDSRLTYTNFNTFIIKKWISKWGSFEELKSYLSKEIPNYMIPVYFREVSEIPLNKNGKIDRKQLKNIFCEDSEMPIESKFSQTKPRTTTEEKVLNVWKNALNNQNIGINDNYFSIGGDSLTATKIVKELSDISLDLSISELYKLGTISECAKYIDEKYNKEDTIIDSGEII